MGKKITPELVASYVKLVPELGERKAAKALGRSQSGMRAALRRSEHAPVRKDRRGNKENPTSATQTPACPQAKSEVSRRKSDG